MVDTLCSSGSRRRPAQDSGSAQYPPRVLELAPSLVRNICLSESAGRHCAQHSHGIGNLFPDMVLTTLKEALITLALSDAPKSGNSVERSRLSPLATKRGLSPLHGHSVRITTLRTHLNPHSLSVLELPTIMVPTPSSVSSSMSSECGWRPSMICVARTPCARHRMQHSTCKRPSAYRCQSSRTSARDC